MTDAPPVLRLSVSPGLFRLLTECILVQSNETRRLETLDGLAAELLAAEPLPGPGETGDLRDHLTAMPSAGPVAVELSLDPRCRRALDAYRVRLEKS